MTKPTSQSEIDISKHIDEIQKRCLGYSFGGPDPKWCPLSEKVSIDLPTNPNEPNGTHTSFHGCSKYAQCDTIKDEIKLIPWEKLSEAEKNHLIEKGCYRATTFKWNKENQCIERSESSSWDINAAKSRTTEDKYNGCIANPWGVRSPLTGEIAKISLKNKDNQNRHRDLSPCPIGGCVTPEMERDYRFLVNPDKEVDWKTARICPFFYRHLNTELLSAAPNPIRFAQCYVTLKDMRDLYEKMGVVGVAPIFRIPDPHGHRREAFWFPLYSGFAFIQLPTRAPYENGFSDRTLPLRWQTAFVARQQDIKVARYLPIHTFLDALEKGDYLSDWEREKRIVSISDGQATFLLLRWLLIRRLEAAAEVIHGNVLNITQRLDWRYDDDDWGKDPQRNIISRLLELGYDIKEELKIDQHKDNHCYRSSTLEEDFQLLGLTDKDGKTTERLQCCLSWIKTRLETKSEVINLKKELLKLLGSAANLALDLCFEMDGQVEQKTLLDHLCWVLMYPIISELDSNSPRTIEKWIDLSAIKIEDKDKFNAGNMKKYRESFNNLNRLYPPIHIIVRAFWTKPIRWSFIPLKENVYCQQDTVGLIKPMVISGVILLTQDSIKSNTYNEEISLEDSEPIQNLFKLRPMISAITSLEERHIREEYMMAQELLLAYERSKFGKRLPSEPSQEKSIELLRGAERLGIFGSSKGLIEVLDMAKLASSCNNAAVLITGESGTGKELVAQMIHELSNRRNALLQVVHCGSVPEAMYEDELFGHEKGAFTGATKVRRGAFELADGGTVFLDEIGNSSEAFQVRLLRVVQFRKFQRLGGEITREVNVRVIAAMNLDPSEAIKKGKLREDLFYRLSVFVIKMPPLRERKEDIIPLAKQFETKFSKEGSKTVTGISPHAEEMLLQYPWPGNIRELENTMQHAVVRSGNDIIKPEHLPNVVRHFGGSVISPPPEPLENDWDLLINRVTKGVEKFYPAFKKYIDDGESDHEKREIIWNLILNTFSAAYLKKYSEFQSHQSKRVLLDYLQKLHLTDDKRIVEGFKNMDPPIDISRIEYDKIVKQLGPGKHHDDCLEQHRRIVIDIICSGLRLSN